MNDSLNILFESLIRVFWSLQTVFWLFHWTNDKAIQWQSSLWIDDHSKQQWNPLISLLFTVVIYSICNSGDTIVKVKCHSFKKVASIFWNFIFNCIVILYFFFFLLISPYKISGMKEVVDMNICKVFFWDKCVYLQVYKLFIIMLYICYD